MTTNKGYLLALSLLLFSTVACADVFQAVVVGLKDSDTIVVLTDEKKQITIRLDSIDGPEKKMSYGSVAKKALSDLIFKKRVTVDSHKIDRYGRTVADIWLDNRLINLEMVKNGMAWVYVKYAKNPIYFKAEREAKASKIGLWSQPNPQAPWEFRHPSLAVLPSTEKMPVLLTAARSGVGYTCGSKRYCKQMGSREEANFYLNQCGLKQLDRDGDGQACESLN